MRAPVFVVGAQRSGTTRLARSLDAHPEIVGARPLKPEPKYFLRSDADTTGPDGWLAACFDRSVGDRIPFEKSTSYIESELAAARIAAVFPDAHVVVLLRDPVERAISNYRFSVLNGIETRPAEVALLGQSPAWDRDRFSVDPYDYRGRSRYDRHLPRWQHRFGERLHVLLFEEFVTDSAVLVSLYEAIGVDRAVVPRGWRQSVNTSTDGRDEVEVPGRVRAQLASQLAPGVRRLRRQLDRPLGSWTSFEAVD